MENNICKNYIDIKDDLRFPKDRSHPLAKFPVEREETQDTTQLRGIQGIK